MKHRPLEIHELVIEASVRPAVNRPGNASAVQQARQVRQREQLVEAVIQQVLRRLREEREL